MEIAAARAQLFSLNIKKNQDLSVRVKLKWMSPEATNMPADLRIEAQRIADRYIPSVALPDWPTVTTNDGVCQAFLS